MEPSPVIHVIPVIYTLEVYYDGKSKKFYARPIIYKAKKTYTFNYADSKEKVDSVVDYVNNKFVLHDEPFDYNCYNTYSSTLKRTVTYTNYVCEHICKLRKIHYDSDDDSDDGVPDNGDRKCCIIL
jgi:hypothetical protein